MYLIDCIAYSLVNILNPSELLASVGHSSTETPRNPKLIINDTLFEVGPGFEEILNEKWSSHYYEGSLRTPDNPAV